jgi:hypothetical protein
MFNLNRFFARRTFFVAAACLLLASACGSSSDDPRVGEDGRVRLVGGGCTSSTTLAVGARVSLRMESATGDSLPGDRDVTSSAPSILTARFGLDPLVIDLQALAQGESRIAITAEGEPLDSFLFKAEPAGLTKHTAEARVFLGGALDVVVTDVFGDCGANEECRLLGHSFLQWRVEPESLGSLVIDFEQVATFRAKGEGAAQLFGREPVRGTDLVVQPFTVLPVAEAKSLSATLTTVPFDPKASATTIRLPGSVARPDAFSVRVDGVLTDGSSVPISWRDVDWRVEGEEIVAKTTLSDMDDRFGTPFLAAGSGKVTLVAEVAMLSLEQAFELDLTAP